MTAPGDRRFDRRVHETGEPAGDETGATSGDADVALVLRSYQAFARGDIGEAVAPLADDVEWVEPDDFPGGGRRVGPGAVAEYLAASYASWQTFASEPTATCVGGRVVVRHAVSGVLADGTPHAVVVADVFTVRDGAVVAMSATTDVEAALAGRFPPARPAC